MKKLRRFTCMCMLMYCMDDRCYLPLHCLITDLIDSCGGSTKLIRYLNRLGICSSLDTLSRVIQQHVNMREHKGPEQELHSSAMMVVSADNIDFMHRYAHNYCGRQSTSWHGTTIQIVQPQPSLPLVGQSENTGSSEGVRGLLKEVRSTPRSVVGVIEGSTGSLHPVAPSCVGTPGPVSQLKDTPNLVNQVLRKGTKRGQSSPYPSPNKSCKSPVPKIQRRARSGVENACIDVNLATQSAHDSTHIRSVPLSDWRRLDTSEFEMSPNEIKSLEELQLCACIN